MYCMVCFNGIERDFGPCISPYHSFHGGCCVCVCVWYCLSLCVCVCACVCVCVCVCMWGGCLSHAGLLAREQKPRAEPKTAGCYISFWPLRARSTNCA